MSERGGERRREREGVREEEKVCERGREDDRERK